MNLIDALKTGRRIRRHKSTVWFDPALGFEFSKDDILNKTDWEVEPERYEFECEWLRTNVRGIYPVGKFEWDKLVGKKCKVTVEVLPDEK